MPNLKLGQRICYLSNMMFWFFPFARLIFLISPGLYLFFGLKIYHANIMEIFSYTVPFLITLLLTNHYFLSKVRWVFVSEIYETMQSLFSIRAVLAVLKNPHAPQFSVTPKMERVHQDLISPLSQPFYWTLGYTILATAFGIWRFTTYPEEQPLIAITLFWALFNMLLLFAALGALYEHRQRRVNPRIPVKIQANWLIKSNILENEKEIPIIIKDISMGGGNLISKVELPDQASMVTFLEVPNEKTKSIDIFQVAITNRINKHDNYIYGVKFKYADLNEYRRIVRFIHGDSSRWVKIHEQTGNDPGLIRSVYFMVKIGFYYGVSHIAVVLTSFFKKIIHTYV